MDLGSMLKELMEETANSQNAVSGKEREKLDKEFVHLDLKPGDAVMRKKGFGSYRIPKHGVICEVFQKIEPIHVEKKGGALLENDFTILLKDGDGDYDVFFYDSRYFDKV